MSTKKESRRRIWSYVLGWVGIIYSTLYVARPVCTFLKETTPFVLLTNILCIVLLIAVLIVLWRKARTFKPLSFFLLAGVFLAYGIGLATIQFPEEKIHFIEYGFLAFLIFKAIRIDISNSAVYAYSFILVSIFGWIDEGIQYILPNRYYQTEDVLLNSVSGFLGLLLVYVFQRNK